MLLANCQHSSPWSWASTLTQNAFVCRISCQRSDEIIGRKPTSGGSSETEANEPMVKPIGRPSSIPVMIVTPVGKCPSTLRYFSGSITTCGGSGCSFVIAPNGRPRLACDRGAMSERMDDKRTIRRRMLLLRDLIDDRLLRSVQLWGDVATLDEYRRAATVMAFCAIAGEPDTDPLFARLAADGKVLVLPRAVRRRSGGGTPR